VDGKKFLRSLEASQARKAERLRARLLEAAPSPEQRRERKEAELKADQDRFYEVMGKLGVSREEGDARLDRFRRMAKHPE